MAAEDSGDALAKEQIKRHAELMSFYQNRFADDHQTISQYFLPQESDIQTNKTEGVAGWTDQIYDTTPIQANQVMAAGQFSWWTPPNQPWAEYEPPEEMKKEEDDNDAQIWLGKASDKIMKELARSNFYSTKAQADLGYSTFATDLVIFDESEKGSELFNFIPCKISTYTIEEDYKGIVDTARREVEMTWRQIEQKFNKPTDTIPEKLRKLANDGKNKGRKFKLLHCIFPREDSDRLPGAKDGKNKPIASVYIAMDVQECIRVSGYDESPILCRRFAKWGTGSVWGYGPAYLALPDARQINYVQQYLDALAELHAYPRVLIPDNLEGDVDLRAGGPTTWDTSNPSAKPEEWMSVGDYKLGIEMQQQRRQAIRDAFFNDAFKLLNSQPLLDKEMTAYEISQRQAEQLQGVAPAFTRQVPEFINPLMQRAFGVAFRAGKLGQAPASLMRDLGGGKKALAAPEIVVTSRFNDALRALKNRGAEETFGFIAKLPGAENHPEWMDPFDMDDTIMEYARNAGMAPTNIRQLGTVKKTSVAQIRAQRAALQQQQRRAALAEQTSKAGKNLGASPEWMQDQVKDQIQGGKKRAA